MREKQDCLYDDAYCFVTEDTCLLIERRAIQMKKATKKIGIIVLVAAVMLTFMSPIAEATVKTFSLTEGSTAIQVHTLTLPNLKHVNNISSSMGSVTVESISGDDVQVRLSGGSYTRRVLTGGSAANSKYVTNQSNSYYNLEGYTGTLTRYVSGTTTGPSQSKTVTTYETRTYEWCNSYPAYTAEWDFASSKPYNQDGYTGTLYAQGSPARTDNYDYGECAPGVPRSLTTRTQTYSGTVTKPGDTVDVYRYQGTVTKPDTRTYDYYFQYDVTADYADNSAPTVPGVIVNPKDFVKGGSVVHVSWGASTDVDGDAITYQLEFYNGAVWETLKSSVSGTSYTHNAPYLNVGTTKYRVRAYDGKEYSMYQTSPDISIDSIAPAISYDITARDWDTSDINVNIAFSDKGSSTLKQVRYAWSASGAKPSNGWTAWTDVFDHSLTQTTDGVWYLHAEAEDFAGNVAYRSAGPYKLTDYVHVPGSGLKEQIVQTNIYIEESKSGTGYLINGKSDNYKLPEVPLPINGIMAN